MELPELLINGASAIGAVGAAIVALAIATKDRRDRRDERHAGDRAQARLVLIEVRTLSESDRYHIDIHNYSSQPILNVALNAVVLQGNDARWELVGDPKEYVLRIIQPETERAYETFSGVFVASDGESIAKLIRTDEFGYNEYEGKPDPGLVHAVVQYTDASGNTWHTDTEGALTYVGRAD